MESIALRKFKFFSFFILINLFTLSGQSNQPIKGNSFSKMNKFSPFYYKGKPNNEFEDHCYITLMNDLIKNVPIPDSITCKNNFGIFVFKVNSFGQIKQLEYFGDLDKIIEVKIKENIKNTSGLYTISKNKKLNHWFVLPFWSHGGNMPEFNQCENKFKLNAEIENYIKFYYLYKNVKSVLPESSNITIFEPMGHYFEMLKRGLILHEEM